MKRDAMVLFLLLFMAACDDPTTGDTLDTAENCSEVLEGVLSDGTAFELETCSGRSALASLEADEVKGLQLSLSASEEMQCGLSVDAEGLCGTGSYPVGLGVTVEVRTADCQQVPAENRGSWEALSGTLVLESVDPVVVGSLDLLTTEGHSLAGGFEVALDASPVSAPESVSLEGSWGGDFVFNEDACLEGEHLGDDRGLRVVVESGACPSAEVQWEGETAKPMEVWIHGDSWWGLRSGTFYNQFEDDPGGLSCHVEWEDRYVAVPLDEGGYEVSMTGIWTPDPEVCDLEDFAEAPCTFRWDGDLALE